MSDSCFNLARTIRRKRNSKIAFTQQQDEGIQKLFGLVNEALTRMNALLSGRKEEYDIVQSEEMEHQINACRNNLKQQNIENLNARLYGYDEGTVFADLINECEKTGDYIINVVEARLGAVRNGIRFRGIQIDTDAKTVTVDEEEVSFSKSEYELLKFFLENRDKVFSKDQLMSAVWADDTTATPHMVEMTITHIRRKIGSYADNLVELQGWGYSFQE